MYGIQLRLREKLQSQKAKKSFSFPMAPWRGLVWLAPIRSKPRRTYDEFRLEFSSEGDHTPYVIRRTLETKKEADRFQRFMDRIGKESGLFERIEVRKYGRSATSPFELNVVLNKRSLSVSNVGYGVSQALPVVVELFIRPRDTWFAVQQPEVHLHPRAQAAIGDVLFQLALEEEKKFFVETHSDFTIDRFRLGFRGAKQVPSAQILFFQRTASGNRVTPIAIDRDGNLPDDQPQEYRDFFICEQLRLVGG
jgi:hypothetical protein